MPPRVMFPRGRGGWGRRAPRSQGIGGGNAIPAGAMGQAPLAEEQPIGATLPTENFDEHWEEEVQDDVHDEVNQEIPHVPTAPPVSAQMELLL